jgi:hypothetical protein
VEAGMPMFLMGATYPIELFNDAAFLRDQAKAKVAERLDDGRNMPTPGERALSRAAIFTAFNFLESLLIELAQDHVTNGPGKGTAYGQAVLSGSSKCSAHSKSHQAMLANPLSSAICRLRPDLDGVAIPAVGRLSSSGPHFSAVFS